MITDAPKPTSAIVRVSWAPVRRDPRHASEMVNQVLLGEALNLLDSTSAPMRPEWAAIRAPDGYEGFVTRGSLHECTESEAADWNSRADTTSLGTGLNSLAVESGTGDAPRHAPWGAKLASAGDGTLELPGGGRANPADSRKMVSGADREIRFPRDPATLVRTATGWLGTPYFWGGRTEQGTDCSGFVQSVFALHGFVIARDSRDQFEAGPKVAAPEDLREGNAGDLWFFAWDGGSVSHVGICVGDQRMIHASETRGCVAIDELGDGGFGRRLSEGFVGAVRPGD